MEEIVDIKGPRNHKRQYDRRTLLLKVRWAGYDESKDTWESFKEFKGNLKFLEFCKRRNLKYLIDKRLFEPHELATLRNELIVNEIKPTSVLTKKRKRSKDHTNGQQSNKTVRFNL